MTGRLRHALWATLAAAAPAWAQTTMQEPMPGPAITPWLAADSVPVAPWHVAGLPNQKKPFTHFSLVDVDGKRALRIEADASYGNLVHPLVPPRAAGRLAWHWRVQQFVAGADLHTKAGDDTAVKVCVFFDLPLADVPFVERQVLRLARSLSAEPLPAATVCYVWDEHLSMGSTLDNPFTRRMRYVVARSGADPGGAWVAERHDVAADFLRLFGDETQQVPAVTGIGVGADADNTHGHSLADVADLVFEP